MASPIDTAASSEAAIAETIDGDYKYGFFTDIDAEIAPSNRRRNQASGCFDKVQ